MPAGTTWPRYLSGIAAGLFSMAAGAQFVHHFYRPLEDLDVMVQMEIKRLREANSEEKNGQS